MIKTKLFVCNVLSLIGIVIFLCILAFQQNKELWLLLCCIITTLFWVGNWLHRINLELNYEMLKLLREADRKFIKELYDHASYLENVIRNNLEYLKLSDKEWKFLLKQVHPDKHLGSNTAQSVTRKLLELRKMSTKDGSVM